MTANLLVLPNEILLEITGYVDLDHDDLRSLRLVHRTLATILAAIVLEVAHVCLRHAKRGSEVVHSSEPNVEGIKAPELSRLRGSVRRLKISIPYNEDYVQNAGLSAASGEVEDIQPVDTLKELFAAFKNLRGIELKAWRGNTAKDLTVSVLRELDCLVGSEGNCKLDIILHGRSSRPKVFPVIMRAIPETVRSLELHDCYCVDRQISHRELILLLRRCRNLQSLTFLIGGRCSVPPYLSSILDGLGSDQDLPLTDLKMDAHLLYEDWDMLEHSMRPPTKILSRQIRKFPRLRKLTISREFVRDGEEGQEVWDALLVSKTWLESVTTSAICGELDEAERSTLFGYLAAPQMATTLKMLDLQWFRWDYQSEEKLLELAEVFWTTVAPNVADNLERLTLLLFARDEDGGGILEDRGSPLPDIKLLHHWSLSWETVVRKGVVHFKNLRELKTYAILDEEPEYINIYWDDDDNPYFRYKFKDDGTSLDIEGLLAYLCNSPRLNATKLYILPGGPFRRHLSEENNWHPDDQEEMENQLETVRRAKVAELYTSICEAEVEVNEEMKFEPGSEMVVNIIPTYHKLESVDRAEFFFGTNGRWNQRRTEERVELASLSAKRKKKEELKARLFPAVIDDWVYQRHMIGES